MSSQILETYDASLTTYLLTVATDVQDVAPRAIQRGVHLDGGLRESPGPPLALAANRSEGGCGGGGGGPPELCIGWRERGGCIPGGGGTGGQGGGAGWNGNNRICGDVRLDTGTYSPTDIDIAMPAPGFSWVIGRTYNARQELSGAHHDSDGYQGRNWFQISQPEIKLYDHPTDAAKDVLYLIYGADRYIEFKRENASSNQFKAKNGAAGVMDFTAASGQEPETYTYTDQNGNLAVFFGFDTNAGVAKGQLWKVTDTDGNVAYVGHQTTGSTAITNGFDSNNGGIKLAYDTAGRKYSYTHSSIDSVYRLTQVKVEVNGGSWTEVNRVDYAYYQTGDNTYGENGNLKLVTITTPLTDTTKNIIRKKYYRYHKSGDLKGTSYQVKLAVDFEGTRNYDWQDSNFNDSFLTATHNALVDYAAAYFEYSSRKISKATFNGQSACAGIATGEGTYDFTYGDNGSHPGNATYDEEWKSRTEVDLPDTHYLTQYFDEVGQPLGQVRTKLAPSQTSGQKTWATQVARDTRGGITKIHSPANVTGYTHSTGVFTVSSTVGLVTTFDRQSSGDLTGFVTDVKHKTGDGVTAYFDLTLTYTTATKTITDSTVVRPFIASRRIYETEITSGTTDSHLTSIAYTFHTGAAVLMPKIVTTTYPIVTTAKNGSNSATTSKQYFNEDGTLGFTKAQDDRVDYMEYTSGQLTKRIDDADTTKTGVGQDFENVTIPTSFDTVGAGAFHRVTTFTYDAQGRTDEVTSDAGGLTKKFNYSFLKSRLQVTLAYNNFDGTVLPDPKFFGPVQYTVTNHAGRVAYQSIIALTNNESTAAINTHVDTTESDVIDAVSTLGTAHFQGKQVYNETGTRVDEERLYHAKPPVPGMGSSTGEGSEGTNYDTTFYAYDAMGRPIRTKAPHGTINRTNYDEIGRAISQEVGTNDNGDVGGEPSGTNNMVKVSESEYDSNNDGGNSHVTKQTQFVEDGTTDRRDTTFAHDVRGRVLLQTNPAEPKHVLNKYDNLSQLTASALYSTGDGTNDVDKDDDPVTRSEDRLSLNRSYFDELGRVYKTTRHKIDQSDGSDDDNLESLTWYDAAGGVIKVQGEEFAKTTFDRLGRQTHQFVLATTNDTGYGDADGVKDDIVLEEHQTVYDPSGSNVLMTVALSRTHDDFGSGETTGALDTNADNDLMKLTSTDLKGQAQITAMWYDSLNRLQDTVQYGTNGGSTFTRTGLTVPSRSDTALRTTYTYDALGPTDTVEDPRAKKTKLEFDDAGRQTKVIRHYDAAVNSGDPSGTDDNQTVEYEFTDGLQTKITARMPSGSDDQVTIYTYGTTKGASAGDSKIATKHLLHKVQYPDSTGGTDVVTHAYNAQSQLIWKKDQVGMVMEFDFDDSGRRTHKRVTTSGGFDTAILRISRTYDTLGRVDLVSSYDNATVGSGTVQNEVKYTYDDWGNISQFDQDRNGAVQPSAGDEYTISYAYEKKGTGSRRYTIRRTTMTLPNGDLLTYKYSSAGSLHDDEASRVTRIAEGSPTPTNRVRYWYLGAGDLVGTVYNQPSVKSILFDSGDAYDALDRFGRITEDRWVNSTSDVYKVILSYDRHSNITDADDSVQTGFDWKYTYDDLDRLIRAQSGTLSGGSITNETRDQNFTLDHPGNWTHTDYDLNADDIYTGTGEYDWDFTHNKANEITQWDNQTDQVVPVYDAAGNMNDDKRDYQYVYDAFYRLVTVKNQSGTVKAEYKYNGLGHRISARYDQTAPWYHFAYDERWRIVAMYEDNDTAPTEQFWHHNAGRSGLGISSHTDRIVLRERDTTADGTFDERRYYLQNWRDDVVVLTDASGGIQERTNYKPFAEPIGALSAIGNRVGNGGYEYDNSSDVRCHVRYRTFNCKLGRWLQRDLVEDNGLPNRYLFVQGNPIRNLDALGLLTIETRECKGWDPPSWFPEGVPTFHKRNSYSDCGEIKCHGMYELVQNSHFFAELPRSRYFLAQYVAIDVRCQCCNDDYRWTHASIKVYEYLGIVPAGVNLQGGKCDTYKWGGAPCVFGTFDARGEVRAFALNRFVGEFPTEWDMPEFLNFRGDCCGVKPHLDFSRTPMHVTRIKPTWWSDFFATGQRSAQSAWDCCDWGEGGCDTTFVHVCDPPPAPKCP